MDFQAEYIAISNSPFGPLEVRYYGIIIVFAMLIAAAFAARLAQRSKLDPDHIWGALTWAIFPGIVGARLWYVIFPPQGAVLEGFTRDWYFQNFFDTTNGAVAIWAGGLSIFGAALGGILGAWLYFGPLHNPIARVFHYIFLPITIIFEAIGWFFRMIYERVRGEEVTPFAIPAFEKTVPDGGMSMLPWLDITGVVMPLAQAIGRWANWVNQELYGLPTNLPWGISIPANKRVPGYEDGTVYPFPGDADETKFHPLFLYEALWSLIAFFVLTYFYNRHKDKFRPGDFFLVYLMQYSFIRFLLEFIRIEQAYIDLGGTQINSSQVFTAIVFLLALAAFVVRRLRNPEPVKSEPVAEAEA